MQARRKRLKDAGQTDYQVTVIIPIAHRDFVRAQGMQAELQELIKSHIRKSFAKKHIEQFKNIKEGKL